MCKGGALVADFFAGNDERPRVPEVVAAHLTRTLEGAWVVWAHKVARSAANGVYVPLTGGGSYLADARARCRVRSHRAPKPDCSCGFHALSVDWRVGDFPGGVVGLEVALSERVLAFEWARGGLLFRAGRQTVMRTVDVPVRRVRSLPPDDPSGPLAMLTEPRPHGAGPVQLRLPTGKPREVEIVDDAGYCRLTDVAPVFDDHVELEPSSVKRRARPVAVRT